MHPRTLLARVKATRRKGVFQGLASTEKVDRHGEIVRAIAFTDSLAEHEAAGTHPKLLAAHAHFLETGEPPVVGWSLSEKVLPDEGLLVRFRFTPSTHYPKGTIPLGPLYHNFYSRIDGMDPLMDGLSVGFMPIEMEDDEDGRVVHVKADLLEYSPVAVPSNAGALVEAAHGSDRNAAYARLALRAFGMTNADIRDVTPNEARLDAFDFVALQRAIEELNHDMRRTLGLLAVGDQRRVAVSLAKGSSMSKKANETDEQYAARLLAAAELEKTRKAARAEHEDDDEDEDEKPKPGDEDGPRQIPDEAVTEDEDMIWIELRPLEDYQDGTLREIELVGGEKPVKATIGKLVSDEGNEDAPEVITVLRFPKADGWTRDDAVAWTESADLDTLLAEALESERGEHDDDDEKPKPDDEDDKGSPQERAVELTIKLPIVEQLAERAEAAVIKLAEVVERATAVAERIEKAVVTMEALPPAAPPDPNTDAERAASRSRIDRIMADLDSAIDAGERSPGEDNGAASA